MLTYLEYAPLFSPSQALKIPPQKTEKGGEKVRGIFCVTLGSENAHIPRVCSAFSPSQALKIPPQKAEKGGEKVRCIFCVTLGCENAHIPRVCSAFLPFASLENPASKSRKRWGKGEGYFLRYARVRKCSHTSSMLRFSSLRKP